jgi:hypothetical protein
MKGAIKLDQDSMIRLDESAIAVQSVDQPPSMPPDVVLSLTRGSPA